MLIICGGLLCGSQESMKSISVIALFTIINASIPRGTNLHLSLSSMIFLFSKIILLMLDSHEFALGLILFALLGHEARISSRRDYLIRQFQTCAL
jgi:hypothetical protein